ncbi:TIGR03757 family integrating conjugative element protein [Burkholderia pseudomallei]|uniref:TIGR03757 family integrating conjugative element protein n=1 Tax=Burkholderia pseudomallei TaxID=28450 RepID=UPI000F05ED0B|nr:TIGR03757 family integrating conjugative element protein [Burkholderia pseudomallei]
MISSAAVFGMALRRFFWPTYLCGGALASLASLFAASPPVAATEVWVVTDHAHPVNDATHARVIELDAPARIEAVLSKDLPVDPKQAASIVRQRLEANQGALDRQLAAAWQAVTNAWSLGVTTVPAVIVDRRYVVYGDPDVPHVLARVQAYREAHP